VEGVRFEWDEAKNLSNQHKHGISFRQASAVFLDPLYVSVQDRIEDGELRWQAIGMLDDLLLLRVAHAVREENEGTPIDIIRIVSARAAIRQERRRYENENR